MKTTLQSVSLCFLMYSPFITTAQSWEPVGSGTNALQANDIVRSLCFDQGNNSLYAGGLFTDGTSSTTGNYYVAKWDGATWSELGASPMTNPISAVCVDNSHNLHAATGISGSAACVVRWDGSSWAELGTGSAKLNANAVVETICSDPSGNIYAAGWFSNSTGKRYVAKWDGMSWLELGSGTGTLDANDIIWTIASDPAGNIYAAGNFTTSAGYPYVAKWNGSAWSMVGSGGNPLNMSMPAPIYSVHIDGSGNLYAGGALVNGSGKWFVAKWDGTTWSEMGIGSAALNANDHVRAINSDGAGNIYAAGNFNIVGKSYVAKWNGTGWSMLGIGTNALNANAAIYALAVDKTAGYIFAGGGFTDGSSSTSGNRYVAKYKIPATVISDEQANSTSVTIYPNPTKGNINITLNASASLKETVDVSVVDIVGNEVKKIAVKTNTPTDIEMLLPAGVYTASYSIEGKFFNSRFCVEK